MRRAIVITAALLIIALMLGGVAAQSPFEIRVFIDNENLTVYIPSSGLVSLRGFGFQVQVSGQTRLYVLEEYAAFGIPFDQLPTPLCFRLRNIGTRIPLAQACNGVTTLTQELAPADVFWFDSVAGVSRALLMVQNAIPLVVCPSGATECTATFTPPTFTPSPTSTPTITPSPTPTPTPTPVPQYEGLNKDWTPQISSINGIDVALVPPGCFTMGSTGYSDSPPHEQCIDEPFYTGVTEITNAQYAHCVDSGGCTPPHDQTYYRALEYADDPVVFVDWFQPRDFAEWWGGYLPTEREWEYAARGVQSWNYPWGDEWESTQLNFCDESCTYEWRDTSVHDGYSITAPVGTFPRGVSWIGAMDMSGNVWEWTSSLYSFYPYDENDNEQLSSASYVMRGGSWYLDMYFAGSAVRYQENPSFHNGDVGFRVALSVQASD